MCEFVCYFNAAVFLFSAVKVSLLVFFNLKTTCVLLFQSHIAVYGMVCPQKKKNKPNQNKTKNGLSLALIVRTLVLNVFIFNAIIISTKTEYDYLYG